MNNIKINNTNIQEYLNNLNGDIISLNLSGKDIEYIHDLSRFTKLEILILNYNKLRSLPLLSKSIKHLECNNNLLTSLPPLNENLKSLDCRNNYLTSLPEFNNNLEYISCFGNKLTRIPSLNENLMCLFCCNNLLTSLPPLNEKLILLYCSNNDLTILPPLNQDLYSLYCCNNRLTSLPSLNENLGDLRCSNNELTFLPPLSKKLDKLYCCNNRLTSFPIFNENTVLEVGNNPIYKLYCSITFPGLEGTIYLNIRYVNDITNKLNKFKFVYYTLKYKSRFRYWLWEIVRQRNIKDKYSPDKLEEILEKMNDPNDNNEFNNLIDNW